MVRSSAIFTALCIEDTSFGKETKALRAEYLV